MMNYTFALILHDSRGIVVDDSQEALLSAADELFAAGCNDASLAVVSGQVLLTFDREADSLRTAVEAAVSDVERAGFHVLRVEPPDRYIYESINARLSARSDRVA